MKFDSKKKYSLRKRKIFLCFNQGEMIMMKLNDNVTRLISAKASQVSTYNGRQLKEAIFKSEGRVLMGQTYLKNPILFPNCTSTELMFAFGEDMVLLNGFDFRNPQTCPDFKGLIIKE